MTRGHQQSVLILWAARAMVVLAVAAWAFSWTWVVGYGDCDVWCALGHGRFTLLYHRVPGADPATGFSTWLRAIGPEYEWAKRNGLAPSPWVRMGLTLPAVNRYASSA